MNNRRTLALIIGLALAGSIAAPMTAAADNAPVIVCPPNTVPGWVDANGNATSCVDNHPCVATATQDWLCNPIAAPVVAEPVPVAVRPPAKVAAVAPPTPTKAPVKVAVSAPVRASTPTVPAAAHVTPATSPVTSPLVNVAGPTVIVTGETKDSVWSTCDLVICV
jgi:hypothetical protein